MNTPQTGRQRRAPDKVFTQCEDVFQALIGREQFYTALRGRARLQLGNSNPENVDLSLAVATPIFLRAEVNGPLGIRMGLLQINNDWVYFYDTRKRLVKRLPTKEFARAGLRREAFLRELPVSLPDPFVVDAVLSRTGVVADAEVAKGVDLQHCPYIKDKMLYELVYKEAAELRGRERWHRVLVDARDFFPVRHQTRLAPVSKRPAGTLDAQFWREALEWDLHYSHFVGRGAATLPRRIELSNRKSKIFTFEWREAEPIKDRDTRLFNWRPSASLKVQDY